MGFKIAGVGVVRLFFFINKRSLPVVFGPALVENSRRFPGNLLNRARLQQSHPETSVFNQTSEIHAGNILR